jgi:hypothetical protein
MMWRIIGVFVVLFSTATMATAREWDFRVLLDKKEIGTHKYVLQSEGDTVRLQSDATYDYKLLSFSLYKYIHHSEETWRDDCLATLNSTSTTNGTDEYVHARRVDEEFRVDHQGHQSEYEGCIKSFAYWNPEFLKATRLLNSQTGEYVSVKIDKVGEELITVQGTRQIADHYELRGPALSIDLWYVKGEWVALKAATDSGSMLRYELR